MPGARCQRRETGNGIRDSGHGAELGIRNSRFGVPGGGGSGSSGKMSGVRCHGAVGRRQGGVGRRNWAGVGRAAGKYDKKSQAWPDSTPLNAGYHSHCQLYPASIREGVPSIQYSKFKIQNRQPKIDNRKSEIPPSPRNPKSASLTPSPVSRVPCPVSLTPSPQPVLSIDLKPFLVDGGIAFDDDVLLGHRFKFRDEVALARLQGLGHFRIDAQG